MELMEMVEAKPNPQRWHIPLDAAISIAQRTANASGLPQTLFRNARTSGWASTNSLAKTLEGHDTEVALTVLPQLFWS